MKLKLYILKLMEVRMIFVNNLYDHELSMFNN